MEKSESVHDFTKGSVWKTLLVFAFPFILSNFLQTFYNLVDMAFIGKYVGSVGLSAVSVSGDIMHFAAFLCMGFATGAQIIISQYVGKRDFEKVSRTIGTFCVFTVVFAAILMVIGFIFSDYFLGLMSVPEEAYTQAKDYLIVCLVGLVFTFGYNTLSAIMRGLGDSKTPFTFVLVATIVNIVLDYVFVGLMNLAAFGAALATIIGQAVSFIAAIIYIGKHTERFCFTVKTEYFKPDKKILLAILRLGIPLALQTCSISLSVLVVNSMANDLGLLASAVNGVAMKIGNVASIVSAALNQAGSSMIGQNFGAGKPERVSQVMLTVGVVGTIFSAILTICLIFFPESIFGIFNDDPEVLRMSHLYIVSGVITFFAFSSRAPFISLVNGIGYAMFSFIVGFIDGVVLRIGLSILFGKVMGMGLTGYWLGGALSGYTFLFVGGAYYLRGKWKTRPLAIK